MTTKPNILVLKTDGTNCDQELAYAFKLAGGNPKIVHINDLRAKKESFHRFHILALPGGFSYGDDIVSGKILALELSSFYEEELIKFTQRKNTLTIGVCNGFQVLIRTGLLPFGTLGKMQATLTNNDSGRFECRWIRLKTEQKSACVFLKNGLVENEVTYTIAHGEGKFFTDNETLKKIEDQNLVVFRYIDENNKPTQKYPDNPNGALNAIAGICDPTGRILGLMPHPERFVVKEHHPNWRRTKIDKPHGLPIFQNMISYVKNS